jgi:hypothetical protein
LGEVEESVAVVELGAPRGVVMMEDVDVDVVALFSL